MNIPLIAKVDVPFSALSFPYFEWQFIACAKWYQSPSVAVAPEYLYLRRETVHDWRPVILLFDVKNDVSSWRLGEPFIT